MMCACAGGVLKGIRETHIVLQLAHIMSQPEHRGPPRLLARRPGGAPGRRRRATLAGRTRTRAVCGCRRGGRRGRRSDDGRRRAPRLVLPLGIAPGAWHLLVALLVALPDGPEVAAGLVDAPEELDQLGALRTDYLRRAEHRTGCQLRGAEVNIRIMDSARCVRRGVVCWWRAGVPAATSMQWASRGTQARSGRWP